MPAFDLPPLSTRTPMFFIDESGSKSSAGKYFVTGLAKTYRPGRLSWRLRNVRERHSFKGEFKFTKVKNDTLPAYKEIINVAFDTKTLLGAFVLDSRESDQFGARSTWQAQADLAAQLVRGNLRSGELGVIINDIVTTPKGVSLSEEIRDRVNARTNGLAIIAAADFDSKASIELQLADIFAGAVNYERKALAGLTAGDVQSDSPKSQLVRHIQATYRINSFSDKKAYLVSIRTAKN
ncbi:MAG: DUF3800 domain-containing protein [Arcanobacterium sp.]